MIDARGATAVAIADGVRAGKLRARDVVEQYLDRIERLDGALGCYLLVDGAGARAAADAVDAAQAAGRDPGPPGRRAARDQGHLLHARDRDHLRFADPPRVRSPLRIHGHRAARRGGRRRAGQAEHGRVRHGLVEREQLVQAGPEPLVDGARARGVVGRVGGGGRGLAVRGRDRHRHGWVDPSAGRPLRRGRDEADLRACLPLRRDRVRVVARSPGAVRADRRGRGGAAGGHGRPRSAGRHQHPAAGRRLPSGGARRGARQGRPEGGAAGRARRSTSSPGWTPRSRRPCAPRSTSSARAGATIVAGLAAPHALRDRDLLSDLHRRGVVEPGALRRRPLRPPRRRGEVARGALHAHARRRVRRPSPSAGSCSGPTCSAPGYYEAYYGKALAGAAQAGRRLHGGVQQVRRHRHADLAGAGVQVRRADGRPPADVPGRHAHRGAEPGRRAGAVAAAAASPRPGCPSGCRSSARRWARRSCFRVGGAYEARTEWHKRLPPEAAK